MALEGAVNGFTQFRRGGEPGDAPRVLKLETLWSEPVSSWTPTRLRAALDEHERGSFYTSACLADAVWRDPVVAGNMSTRVRALASRSALPFTVEPGDGDGRRREAVRKRVEELWWTSLPEPVVSSVLVDSIGAGLAVGAISWTMTSSEWVPQLHHLPLHGLEFDQTDGEFYYNDQAGTRHKVTPGDGRWFLHLPYGERSWMRGCLRAIALPWLMRTWAMRDWARWCEKHGLPILKINEPHFAQDDTEQGTGSAAANAFYKQIARGLGSEVALRCPQGDHKDVPGWDADWLELVGRSYEGHRDFLKSLRTEIDIAVLGRDTTVGGRGGDGEVTAERVRVEFLSSDAEPLSTTIRDCVWKPFVAFNYGGGDLELAPWGRWNTRPPVDLRLRAAMLDRVADSMTKLWALGVKLSPILDEFQLEAADPDANGEPKVLLVKPEDALEASMTPTSGAAPKALHGDEADDADGNDGSAPAGPG